MKIHVIVLDPSSGFIAKRSTYCKEEQEVIADAFRAGGKEVMHLSALLISIVSELAHIDCAWAGSILNILRKSGQFQMYSETTVLKLAFTM
jgi:hypothetical protein